MEPYTLREKCPNTGFFCSVFSRIRPNTGKRGPEKNPCLDTFHALILHKA